MKNIEEPTPEQRNCSTDQWYDRTGLNKISLLLKVYRHIWIKAVMSKMLRNSDLYCFVLTLLWMRVIYYATFRLYVPKWSSDVALCVCFSSSQSWFWCQLDMMLQLAVLRFATVLLQRPFQQLSLVCQLFDERQSNILYYGHWLLQVLLFSVLGICSQGCHEIFILTTTACILWEGQTTLNNISQKWIIIQILVHDAKHRTH